MPVPTPPAPSADTVAERLAEVRRSIAAEGRDPERVRVVAVTKGFGPDAVLAARAASLADVGENYAQELVAKASAVGADAGLRWHLLGPVQRNKVRRLAGLVDVWQAIDRRAAADAVAAAAPGTEVMVQVNVAADPGRSGCHPSDLDDLVGHVRQLPVDLTGLMAVAPLGPPATAGTCFSWLAGQARRLGLRELSMGMSGDYRAAVAAGATTIRLGRVLFGPRPERRAVQR